MEERKEWRAGVTVTIAARLILRYQGCVFPMDSYCAQFPISEMLSRPVITQGLAPGMRIAPSANRDDSVIGFIQWDVKECDMVIQ